MPNKAYHNLRGKGYADVTLPSGLGHLQKGHGVAFADLDFDGDLDIFCQMGGAFRSDKFHNACFENPGFGNHWVKIRLVGTVSNKAGVGSRIRAEITEDGESRSVYVTVSTGASFGCNPLQQHIGLGKATKIDVLEVFWPASNTTQVFKDLPVDRRIRITEGSEELEISEEKPIPFRKG